MDTSVFMKWIGLLLFSSGLFVALYHYNARLLEWLRYQSLGTRDYIVERLNQMFIDVSSDRVLLGLFGISFGAGSLVFLLFLPQWFPGLLFGSVVAVAGWKLPRPLVDWLYQRRLERFLFQLVDALNLMSNGLKSGLSVPQAIGLVVQEMPDPVRQEFNLVLGENKLGVPLEEALNSMAKRMRADDVEMLVTSINILKETGGNLAESFDTIATTIRERIKVEKKIQVLTASGFYQGMFVMAMPPILGVVFYTTDPEFMSPLFTTALGWTLVTVVLALEVVAFFVIMRIIKINV